MTDPVTSVKIKVEENASTVTPVVSVVTVVFNGASCIEGTIRSVLDQDYAGIEYIIVDGGSRDGTQEIIRKYEARIARWISEPDKGISDAFNKAIGMARGEWICFLNAGDSFISAGIVREVMENAFGVGTDHSIITGYVVNQDYRMPDRPLNNAMNLYKRSLLGHQATFFSRRLFDTYGGFRPYSIRMDYEFLMRVLRKEKFQFIEKNVSRYDLQGKSSRAGLTYAWEGLRVDLLYTRNPCIILIRLITFLLYLLKGCMQANPLTNVVLQKLVRIFKRFIWNMV